MEKMASELDMLNGEAVRESPVTETGYRSFSRTCEAGRVICR